MSRLTTLLIAIPLAAYCQHDSDRWTRAADEEARHVERGQYAAAVPASAAALREAGGPLQAAISLSNLLNLHVLLGRYEEAERFSRRAMKAAGALDPNADVRAAIWHNTAHLYKVTGRYGQAEGQFRKALKQLESAPDVDIGWLATVRLGLGTVLLSQNRLVQAEQSLTRSMLEARQSKDDSIVSLVTTSLGELFTARDRLAEAEVLFLEAIATRERASGPEHPYLALPLHQLAQTRFAQRRYAEADSFCRRSIAVVENLSLDHPQLIGPMELYAKILRAQNRKTEAKEWAKRAEALKKIQPDWQRHTVSVNALAERR